MDVKTVERVSTTGSSKPKLLMKPVKVPTWTKDLTLETYIKQLLTWSDILEDIPEYIKYADLMESLNTNKEVKGLPRFVGEHMLPVLERKQDQLVKRVLEILQSKYGRTQMEKVKEYVKNWLDYKEDQIKEGYFDPLYGYFYI